MRPGNQNSYIMKMKEDPENLSKDCIAAKNNLRQNYCYNDISLQYKLEEIKVAGTSLAMSEEGEE